MSHLSFEQRVRNSCPEPIANKTHRLALESELVARISKEEPLPWQLGSYLLVTVCSAMMLVLFPFMSDVNPTAALSDIARVPTLSALRTTIQHSWPKREVTDSGVLVGYLKQRQTELRLAQMND